MQLQIIAKYRQICLVVNQVIVKSIKAISSPDMPANHPHVPLSLPVFIALFYVADIVETRHRNSRVYKPSHQTDPPYCNVHALISCVVFFILSQTSGRGLKAP